VYSLKLDAGTIEQAKQILRLPTKGKHGIKGCAFLTDTNECQVYDKRPRACREFPIWITETPTQVVLEVALLCPRAKGLATVLRDDPSESIRILIGERQHGVVLV
jgi:Fe-S-cluster containining protein